MTDMCHFFMDYHFILISSGLQLKKKMGKPKSCKN